MKEIWKDIEGFEGIYQISNLGNVRSLPRIVNRKDGASCHKEGKAIKLFSNLNELLRASKKQDEEMELYNTLSEDYDVAKKAIKKTSFKDIIKGSYLTNVLKNVSKIFRSEPMANPVPDISRDIAPVLINELTRINNHFVTLIRKALSLL